MALEFGGTKDPELIIMRRFEHAAGLLKVDPKRLTGEVRVTVEKPLDAWPSLIKASPLTEEMRSRMARGWTTFYW
jgi:serine/threonine-protein kinase HipA